MDVLGREISTMCKPESDLYPVPQVDCADGKGQERNLILAEDCRDLLPGFVQSEISVTASVQASAARSRAVKSLLSRQPATI